MNKTDTYKPKKGDVVQIIGHYAVTRPPVLGEILERYMMKGIDKSNKGVIAMLRTNMPIVADIKRIKSDYEINRIITDPDTCPYRIYLTEAMYPDRGNKLSLFFNDNTKLHTALRYICPIDDYGAWDTSPMTKEERLDGLDIHGEPRG